MPRPDGPSLALLQRRLFDLITAPAGVSRALETLGMARGELDAMLVGDARAGAVERLDVYANMYFYRILDVLRDYFPKLAAALGADVFHNLVTDYLVAHPSRHPSLRSVGAALPGFVAAHPLAAGRPWPSELAALEWARLDVFDRADVPPLARAGLAALAPEAFAALALRLVPAHEIVAASAATLELWRAVEAGREPAAPPAADPALAVLVWRRGVTVHHRPLDGGEADALAFVRRGGASFGALCDELGRAHPDDQAARRAAGLLGRWLDDELLAAS